MPAGETPEDHVRLRQEESEQVDRDKANKSGTSGGLFRGWFQRTHPTFRAVRDAEDGVDRCPICNWELEDLRCFRCEISFDHERRMILHDGENSWSHSSEDELDEEMEMEDDDGFDTFPTSTADGYSDFYSRDGTAAPSSASPSYSPHEYPANRARAGRLTRSQRGLDDEFASLAESSVTSNSDTVDEQDGDEDEEEEGCEDENEDEDEDEDGETDSMQDFIDDSDMTGQTMSPPWGYDLEPEEELNHFGTIPVSSHERRRSPTTQARVRNAERDFRAAADLLSDLGIELSPPFRPRRRPSGLRHVENVHSEGEENERDGLDAAGPSNAPVTNRRKRSRTESTSTTDDASSLVPSRSAARIRTRGDISRTSRQRRSTIRGSNRAANNAALGSVPVEVNGDFGISESPNSIIPGRRSAFSAFASRPRLRTRANLGASQDNAINLDGDSNLEASTQASRRRRHETSSRRQALHPSPIVSYPTRQPRRRAPTPHSFTDPETSDDAGTLTGISFGTTREGSEEEPPSESESLSSGLDTRRITRSGRHRSSQAEPSRNVPARNRQGAQR